jgi:hypothetical protein
MIIFECTPRTHRRTVIMIRRRATGPAGSQVSDQADHWHSVTQAVRRPTVTVTVAAPARELEARAGRRAGGPLIMIIR